MLSDLQRRAAEAIVNVFETSQVLGDYSKVTLIPGDSGRLTYGRSQTTLGSGGLEEVVRDYVGTEGADLAADLAPFLPAIEKKEDRLDHDTFLRNLLRAAADDPVMRSVQDRFFEKHYWLPAVAEADSDGIVTALGVAVVYDSSVHGSWKHIRGKTRSAIGSVEEVMEKAWIRGYVETRREWLANHRRKDLRATTYRMDSFRGLIAQEAWELTPPFVVRGLEVSEHTLTGSPRGVFDGPAPRSRKLEVTQPLTRGLDVRRVQLAMSRPEIGRQVAADGLYGPGTRMEVLAFQESAGLPPTGVVDEAAFDTLGL